MRKVNYLNNKDILKEIHKSKLTYCSFIDDSVKSYDAILLGVDKITKKAIQEARKARAERLAKEAQEAERDPSSATYPEPFSAYIHLPFCKKKCRYCDFPVIAVGMRPEVEKIQDSMKTYVDAVCREIISTKRLNTSGPLKTIFFGGGTPALIPPALLEQIVTTLDKAFGISLDAEISIECDPGTFTAPQLRS